MANVILRVDWRELIVSPPYNICSWARHSTGARWYLKTDHITPSLKMQIHDMIKKTNKKKKQLVLFLLFFFFYCWGIIINVGMEDIKHSKF